MTAGVIAAGTMILTAQKEEVFMSHRTLFAAFVLFALLLPAFAMAQSSARITTLSAIQGDENAQFTVTVLCDNEVQYTLDPGQIIITDNGKPVEEFSIVESSSPAVRNAISAALVLDASGSMSGTGNAGTKAATKAFIDLMDGSLDEATILWFNQTVNLQQQMTTLKPLLNAAADALPASGATAVWDATYQGILEVFNSGVNQKRAVIVLTDGGDNSSMRTPLDVVFLAQQKNIRVFTIGLGGAIQQSTLQDIANLTGGQYYQAPTANDLQQIFTTISTFMSRGFDEHTIAYRTPEPDATQHAVVIRINICDELAQAEHSEAVESAVTSAGHLEAARPMNIELGQNAPNPFNATVGTVIPYHVLGTSPRHVTLEVYDLLGRRMAVLVDREQPAGSYSVQFNGGNLARGTYLYRLSTGASVQTRLMQLR